MLGNRRVRDVLIPIGLRNMDSRKTNELAVFRKVLDNEGLDYTRPCICNHQGQILMTVFFFFLSPF